MFSAIYADAEIVKAMCARVRLVGYIAASHAQHSFANVKMLLKRSTGLVYKTKWCMCMTGAPRI